MYRLSLPFEMTERLSTARRVGDGVASVAEGRLWGLRDQVNTARVLAN
jgi:hypothetical protein